MSDPAQPREPTGSDERPGPDKADASRDPVPQTGPAPERRAGLDSRGKVRRTRASSAWVGLIVAALLAILLLVFIIQNSGKVAIKFLGWDGSISLAVALLLAAVAGVLVVAIPGSVRILQLRRALRKNTK